MAVNLGTRRQQEDRVSSLLSQIDGIEDLWRYAKLTVDGREEWIKSVENPIALWKERVIDDEKMRDQLLAMLGENREAWKAYAIENAKKAKGKEVDGDILGPQVVDAKSIELTATAAGKMAEKGKDFEAYLNGGKIDMWVYDCAVRLLLAIVKDFQDKGDGYFSRLIGAPKPAMHRKPMETRRRRLIQGTKRRDEDEADLLMSNKGADLNDRTAAPDSIPKPVSHLSGAKVGSLKRPNIDSTEREADERTTNKRLRAGKSKAKYDPKEGPVVSEEVRERLRAQPAWWNGVSRFLEEEYTPQPEDQQTSTKMEKVREIQAESTVIAVKTSTGDAAKAIEAIREIKAIKALREGGASNQVQVKIAQEDVGSSTPRPGSKDDPLVIDDNARVTVNHATNDTQGNNRVGVINNLDVLGAQADAKLNQIRNARASLVQQKVRVQKHVQEFQHILNQMVGKMQKLEHKIDEMRAAKSIVKKQRNRLEQELNEAEADQDAKAAQIEALQHREANLVEELLAARTTIVELKKSKSPDQHVTAEQIRGLQRKNARL